MFYSLYKRGSEVLFYFILVVFLQDERENREFKKKIKTTGGGPPPATPKPKEEIALSASMMAIDLAMGNEVYDSFILVPSEILMSMLCRKKVSSGGKVKLFGSGRNINHCCPFVHYFNLITDLLFTASF